uniref:Uncharacterized protein n=1 Tax=Lactuca sativa TaxID=4236 RepID=A0A9R1UG36_LACSA|nr:hypothetical protein LSAT_V11C900487950 [Lactuca sativa]
MNLKIQNLKLRTATKEHDDLNSLGDVHSIMLHLLDHHDSVLTISIRRHLAAKLRPALDILSRIEGVLVTSVKPQQGGEKVTQVGKDDTQPPPESKSTATPNDIVASAAKGIRRRRRLEKMMKMMMILKISWKTKPTNKVLEKKIEKETIELEKKLKEKELLEKKKSIFPKWTIQSLQIEAIDEPSTHWLEPVMSFGLENSKDVQFDIPITRKAFIFHCFISTAVIPSPDRKVERDLLAFYLEFAQPQYLTWSLQKITTVKILKPYAAGKFFNVKFKVT